MSKMLNFNEPRTRKNAVAKEEKLIKNQECITCMQLFDCKGKPRGVEACLNYIERRREK